MFRVIGLIFLGFFCVLFGVVELIFWSDCFHKFYEMYLDIKFSVQIQLGFLEGLLSPMKTATSGFLCNCSLIFTLLSLYIV